MDGAGDIAGLAIPFAAGAYAAALWTGAGSGFYWWSGMCSTIFLAFLFVLSCRSASGRESLYLLYFVLGIFCLSTAKTSAGVSPNAFRLTGDSLQGFSSLIEKVGFSDKGVEALVLALLTGRKDRLDREIIENFRAAGASHILALSGLHLGIIYGIINRLTSLLGNSRVAVAARSSIAILASGYYAMMTGASASIIRAFLFILLNEIARLMPGRKATPSGIFFSSLMIQLALDPTVILETGFRLSYLAVLGIVLLHGRIKSWYPSASRFDPFRKLWSSISLSISCQVFTAPYVWFQFSSFPTYFLITNLIALPLTELLIISALSATVLCAAGFDAGKIKALAEFLGQSLIFCLETIGGM